MQLTKPHRQNVVRIVAKQRPHLVLRFSLELEHHERVGRLCRSRCIPRPLRVLHVQLPVEHKNGVRLVRIDKADSVRDRLELDEPNASRQTPI